MSLFYVSVFVYRNEDTLKCDCKIYMETKIEVKRESIGTRIKRVRKMSGLTLKDVQSKCGVSAVTLSAIENGADTKISTVLAIEQALGVQLLNIEL